MSDLKRCPYCNFLAVGREQFENHLENCRPVYKANSIEPNWHVDPEPDIMELDLDNVNHPSHYAEYDPETIDMVSNRLDSSHNLTPYQSYLWGNIIKYVDRFPHKNGGEDLKKARWYINELLSNLGVE